MADASAEEELDDDQVIKYGRSDGQDRWEPCPATLRQLRYQRLGLAFSAAFMAGCLWYIWLSGLSSVFLPPSPWFIFVLAGMIPATTLGALFINHDEPWIVSEMMNRVITGMGCALVFLGLTNVMRQVLLSTPGGLQLAVMLLVTALGAVTGTATTVHKQILTTTASLLKLLRYHLWPVVVIACIFGGLLGSLLAAGLVAWGFTLLGMLLGIGIVIALILRVDYLLKLQRRS
jgi:hypothetical protein